MIFANKFCGKNSLKKEATWQPELAAVTRSVQVALQITINTYLFKKAHMKTVFIVLSILMAASFVLSFNFKSISRAGETPGLVGGMLAKCPKKPNCVCSEYRDDANHYIDPLIIPQNNTFDTSSLLKTVIQDMGGNVQIDKDNYLAATFTSAIFKFVDDLEIRIDSTQKLIHIRSASRIGYSDLGVNKRRANLLKKLFNHKVR